MTQARIKVKERVYRERITRVKVEERHPVMWCCGW